MRKIISRLLILCLFLCGCSKAPAVEALTAPSSEAVPPGLYDAGSRLEISSLGAIKTYPLEDDSVRAIRPLGDGLLLFSEDSLTLLTGDTLIPAASKALGFPLDAEDCVLGDTLSYFDPIFRETVVLNTQLEEISRIPAPKALAGIPLLSPAGTKMYYTTGEALRVWDLETNIHQVLRQTPLPVNTRLTLCWEGAALRCTSPDGRSIFLSTATGELLDTMDTPLLLAEGPEGYIAASWETNLWSLVFGKHGHPIQALTPRELSSDYYLLAERNAVVTATLSGKVVTLDYYDLSTGRRTASQMVQGRPPEIFLARPEGIYGLMYLEEYLGFAILRWDVDASSLSDPTVYTGNHYTADDPDWEGLSQCQDYARQIGQRYGLEILVWEEAGALAPGLTPEHRVNILNRELQLLDHRLSQFPKGMLAATAANFHSLKLGLVAQIEGDDSLQFFDGRDACIVLTAGSTSEQALYHALFHVMETQILGRSSAFDQWDKLNPQGFRYDFDYAVNAIRNSGMYLTEKNRSFIDTFSMSFPKEDRARIFEYAMLPGQEAFFQTKAMQKKLAAVCLGIRQAYGLTEGGTYPWEQYLK